jgi:hypothetical protein
MSNAYTGTTRQFSTPYLTLDEFKNAPTSIDIDNLVFNSQDPDVQDSELANVIARASSWIDTFCNQVIAATVETEQQRSRLSTDGSIRLHPRYSPVVALMSFNYGYPPSLNSLGDCSVAWIEDQEIIVPNATLGTWTSQGPLQFGLGGGGPSNEVFMKYTYVAGYANTTIDVPAAAGATTIQVKDGTGILAGQMLKIYNGQYSENVTVASNYVFDSDTVPLVRPLVYAQKAGTSISALPPAIKEAAVLVTTSFLKTRGDSAMTMGVTTTPSNNLPNADRVGQEIALAMQLLQPYRRVR